MSASGSWVMKENVPVMLAVDELDLDIGHEALLKDTTNNEFIGRMCIYPKLGQRA
jgi:hypothetical protein